MAGDCVATVAAWLADQPHHRVPLGALLVVMGNAPLDRRSAQRAARQGAGAPVLAALCKLDAAGLIRFAHHMPPVVGVLDRDGLRCVANVSASAVQQRVVQPLPSWRDRR